jgi:hypothetical protein
MKFSKELYSWANEQASPGLIDGALAEQAQLELLSGFAEWSSLNNILQQMMQYSLPVPGEMTDSQKLSTVVALALSKPGQHYATLLNFLQGNSKYQPAIRSELNQLNKVQALNIIELYKSAGEISHKWFCDLFDVKDHDLALEIVFTDDVDAARQLERSIWGTKVKGNPLLMAVAKFPYRPLSNVGAWYYPSEQISATKMMARYKNQVWVIGTEEGSSLYSISECRGRMAPGERFKPKHIEGIDYKLQFLPGFKQFLTENRLACADELLHGLVHKTPTNNTPATRPIVGERLTLALEMINDLLDVGVSKDYMLYRGILNKSQEWMQDYNNGLFSHLPRSSYLECLIDTVMMESNRSNDVTLTMKNAIRILLRLESANDLLNACCTDSQYKFLYDFMGDQRFLEAMTPSGQEQQLAQDLGV